MSRTTRIRRQPRSACRLAVLTLCCTTALQLQAGPLDGQEDAMHGGSGIRLVASAALGSAVVARVDAAVSLADAIELVRRHDPRVLASELLVRRAQERAAKTEASGLPQASVGLDVGRQHLVSSQGGTSLNGSKRVLDPSLSVTWDVDAFGTTKAHVAESLALARSEEAKYRRSWEVVLLETVELYVNLYRLRQQLEITRETLLGYSDLTRIMDDRFAANMTSAARRNEAVLRMREILDEREDILSQLKQANQSWRTLVGTEPPERLLAPTVHSSYRGKADLDVAESVAQAERTHPQIESNRYSIEANRRLLEALKSDRYPKISLFFTQSNTDPGSASGVYVGSTTDRTTRAGVRLRWDFFGHAYGNTIAEQAYALQQNEAEQEHARREVARNVSNTIDVLSNIKDRQTLIGETLRLSEEVLDQRLEAFRTQSMSEDSISNLHTAYQGKARARVTLLNLQCREIVASYTLLENRGQLSQVYPPPATSFPKVPIRHFTAAVQAQ